jgi:hypothetical protein
LVHGHESSKINTALTDRQRQTWQISLTAQSARQQTQMAAYGYNHDGICHIKSCIKLCKGGGLLIFWRYSRANILTANENSIHKKSANWSATTQDVNNMAHL